MVYYYLLAALFTLLALLETVADSKEIRFVKPVILFYGFLILFLFAAFRGENFSDYRNYLSIFDQTYAFDELLESGGQFRVGMHGEYLFLLFISFVKSITNNPVTIFIAFALFAVGINFYCFKKYSPYVLVSIILYVSHVYLYKELIQIRAGLGGALVLLSVLFIQRQQVYRFVATILIAGLIHYGSLVALPFYWLCKIQFSKRVLYLSLLSAMVLAQFRWLFDFLALLGHAHLLPYGVWLYMIWDSYVVPLPVFNPVTIKQIIICLIAIYYKDYLGSRLPYFKPLLILYVFSTAWLIAFHEFSILAARVASFLSVGEVILLPSLALLFKEKRVVLTAIIMFACTMFYLNIAFKEICPPYQSILFE